MFDSLIALEEDTDDVAEDIPRPAGAAEVVFDDDPGAAPPLELKDASPAQLLGAQAGTASWLDEIGAFTGGPEDSSPPSAALDEQARSAAREAFAALTTPGFDPLAQKARLMALSAPPAVRHLAGMLSQYDWEFVKQAKEIRGYIVAKLVEHSKNADPKVSLSALKALGTVTEVGAFTERVEISRPPAEATPSALADAIRAKVRGFLPRSRVDTPQDVPFVERIPPSQAAAP